MYTQVTHPKARLYRGRNPARSSGAEEPLLLSDTFPGERRGREMGD